MTFAFADCVVETSTTTGTGTYSLAGAPAEAISFVAGVGDGNSTIYKSQSADGQTWEIVRGVVAAGGGGADTLTRAECLKSTNSDNLVNWGAGTRTLFVFPASAAVNALLAGNFSAGGTRPAWVRPGGEWVDGSGTPWLVMRYDGTNDHVTASVNTSTGDVVPYYGTDPISLAGLGAGAAAVEGVAAGGSGGLLRVDGPGDALTLTGGLKSRQVFTGSGTWTKPAGITLILVRLQAPGGGGGGVGTASANKAGGGGGGGGYTEKLIDVSAIDDETVTLGSAGAAGANTGGNGGDGGNSSFGAHCSAEGGKGGEGVNTAAGGEGGAGGDATGGDFKRKGQAGGAGISGASAPQTSGGTGGGPGGGKGAGSTTAGSAGADGGGGGGAQSTDTSGQLGGAGGAGWCVVEEYA
ncbi:MAG: hypothetical protein AB7H93_23650 [Vicinamibacterales bacterium]